MSLVKGQQYALLQSQPINGQCCRFSASFSTRPRIEQLRLVLLPHMQGREEKVSFAEGPMSKSSCCHESTEHV